MTFHGDVAGLLGYLWAGKVALDGGPVLIFHLGPNVSIMGRYAGDRLEHNRYSVDIEVEPEEPQARSTIVTLRLDGITEIEYA